MSAAWSTDRFTLIALVLRRELSATGDLFGAIAKRCNTTVAELSHGLDKYHPGETGLLRLTWDSNA